MSLKFEVHIPDNPAPGHNTITEADIQYISDKLIHTRAAHGIVNVNDRVSSDYSKLFEAGKTILHSVRYLLEIFSFHSIELHVYRHDQLTECICYIDHVEGKLLDKMLKLTFIYDENNHPKPINKLAYVLTMSRESEDIIYQRVYTLNDNGIMSYDMNFPSPVEFIQDIYQATIQH